jgi:hypothetical protein
MEVAKMIQILTDSKVRICDWMFDTNANTDNGWKLSIQGKSVIDAITLYQRLNGFLFANNVPFKIATQKRINLENKVQANKVMTIYIPNGVNRFEFAEAIYSMIIDYKGWNDITHIRHGLKGYETYAGGIFMRNDRDEYGNYIPAN